MPAVRFFVSAIRCGLRVEFLLRSRKLGVVCTLLLCFAFAPLLAQRSRAHQNTQPVNPVDPDNTSVQNTDPRSRSSQSITDAVDEPESGPPAHPQQHTCTFEPYPGLSNTVNVQSLRAPQSAQSEYQKACADLRNQKLPSSEQHLRKALKIYPADAQGWVVLGKILSMSGKLEEAADACSQALSQDSSSWAGNLCLAEINGRQQKWTQSLAESNTAVSLNPETRMFADYFSAIALFNLRELPQAEVRALELQRMDRDHALPPLEYMIAQIEEVKGNLPAARDQLREYLKYAKDPDASERAKRELERLEQATK